MPTVIAGRDEYRVKKCAAWIHVAGRVGVDLINGNQTYNIIVDLDHEVAEDNDPCVSAWADNFRMETLGHLSVRADLVASTLAESQLTIVVDAVNNGNGGTALYGIGFSAAIPIECED